MPSLYIFELENNKYYIGKTNRRPNERILEHFQNNGSEWTKIHKPIKIIEIIDNVDEYDEDKYTKIYMKKYGVNNVRGGSYTTIKLPDYQIKALEKELLSSDDRCFRCKRKGHMIKDCYASVDINGKYIMDKPNKEDNIPVDLKNYKGKICYKCGRLDHEVLDCVAHRHIDGSEFDNNTCYRCGRKGHWRITCKEKKDIYGRQTENLCIIM